MKINKTKSFIVMLYLSCSFFLAVFLMCMIFQVLGYWVGGGKEIFHFISDNIGMYLKISTSGFLAGFMFWLFGIR
ncbi:MULTISPECIES: hypothetical protein [Yersinia pseudotuberculosis complex]|uniref:Uncharacterized protein n=2 Tax=Yersinia pseudotuberculosis complex TaxID=1649845 RepID=A0A380QD82_YERPU|nr:MULTISPECIES: hypothetical protein [Yersinia pseudotuberculosis complex]AHK21931.1 hypothetical protein BF17_04780 [Yersinia similis]AYW91802.1 hypothetical protein EGX47_11085 [Yersinia pseudotuberculosis]KGA58803.1 putative membrane protein [Yersinia pseudotuberculosis]MBO1632843.1 hypothetical protein [Yersinia pseudotuberculosis]MBP0072625.1 hypothetical protein [Yersinia pseudotuberculosis]